MKGRTEQAIEAEVRSAMANLSPEEQRAAVQAAKDELLEAVADSVRSAHERLDQLEERPHSRDLSQAAARSPAREGPGGVLPLMVYLGVWRDVESYQPGDVVTYKSTVWHCGLPTRTKPGTSHDWQMMAKSETRR